MGENSLEVWGGVESTCNRVGNRYFDQMDLSGHAGRPKDYERFWELGIETFRLGLLWERHERNPSWAWSDSQLEWIREAGLRPIAGLVHHGSGPRHTSLLDPRFPSKLAVYAGAVAARYPWIDAYTPINEPNTTARFSALYGIWYPHHQSRHSYVRALLNQLKATVLSMRAIRQVRSDAKLIQTDDGGRLWSTSELSATCDLLNERRWLPFDLLCGTVDRFHPLYGYMRAAGISEAEIFWFRDNPCPPSVVGLNYYLTSDRFLDHRLDLYPDSRRSAEGPFVDIEAVRVCQDGISGFDSLLVEAWDRYRIPTAITEVHLGSTEDEQIRWALEAWNGALRAQQAGVKCVAITFWALLGSFFWNHLVTCANGHYEPGVFDVSGGDLKATELAGVVAQLARGEQPCHPALAQHGWWRQPCRIHYDVPFDIDLISCDAISSCAA